MEQYTRDVENFFATYRNTNYVSYHKLSNGLDGIKIASFSDIGGGYYPIEGEIITFWYK